MLKLKFGGDKVHFINCNEGWALCVCPCVFFPLAPLGVDSILIIVWDAQMNGDIPNRFDPNKASLKPKRPCIPSVKHRLELAPLLLPKSDRTQRCSGWVAPHLQWLISCNGWSVAMVEVAMVEVAMAEVAMVDQLQWLKLQWLNAVVEVAVVAFAWLMLQWWKLQWLKL